MVDHGQLAPGQGIVLAQGGALARHDHRQVVGVGLAEGELGIVGLEGIGGAQQVDLAAAQCGDGLRAIAITTDLDGDAQLLGDQAGVVGAQSFVVGLAGVDVERWVVGARTAEHQRLARGEPLAIVRIERQWLCCAQGACQQMAAFAGDCAAADNDSSAASSTHGRVRPIIGQATLLRLARSTISTSDSALSFSRIRPR